jgi:5-methylcytosine-specific restriction protein A
LLLKFYNLVSGRSPLWSQVRKEHLKKQPFCQACGSKIRPEVHHIEPFHVNPERELDPSNLITLCDKYCHYTVGHLMDYKSWNTNVVQDSKVYLDKVLNRPYKNMPVLYAQNNPSGIIGNFCKFIASLFWDYRP